MGLFEFLKRAETKHPPKRDWNSLPSVAAIEVTPWVTGREIVDASRKATTDLICVGYGPLSKDDADIRRQIELSYHFSDDPLLVIMLLHFNHCLLVRRTFILDHAEQLSAAQGSENVIDQLNAAGRAGGYHSAILLE